MGKKVIFLIIAIIAIGSTFAIGVVDAQGIFSTGLGFISPDIGSLINGILPGIFSDDRNKIDTQISDSRSSLHVLNDELDALYESSPNDIHLGEMKSNVNKLTKLFDETERLQKSYSTIEAIQMKIDESESIIENVNVSESTFDSLQETIEEIDEKIESLMNDDSENEEYLALNENISQLAEHISDSQAMYENHIEYKNQIAELDAGISELSINGITDSRILGLESKTDDILTTLQQNDEESLTKNISEKMREINEDVDLLLEDDPNNIKLISIKSNVYELGLLTSGLETMYLAPEQIQTPMTEVQELLPELKSE